MTNQLPEPAWLAIAKKYEGLKEIPGTKHNPQIVAWAKDLSGGVVKDDETAWCGTFVGGVLKEAGLPLPPSPLSARSYLSLPVVLDKPAVGAIVVFWRDKPSGWLGHVGIIGGKDKFGNLVVISGNSDNMVCWRSYTTSRILGYRWPSKYPLEQRFNLPLLSSGGEFVKSEA